jgi:hypothetical protein
MLPPFVSLTQTILPSFGWSDQIAKTIREHSIKLSIGLQGPGLQVPSRRCPQRLAVFASSPPALPLVLAIPYREQMPGRINFLHCQSAIRHDEQIVVTSKPKLSVTMQAFRNEVPQEVL